MHDLSIAISLFALIVSTAGLTISLMNYLRDRSDVYAWCGFAWQNDLTESLTPVLVLRIMNKGRRPVVVLNLVKHGATQTWWRAIKQPELEGKFTLDRLPEFRAQLLAQVAGIKLNEGEVVEILFTPENVHEFYFTNDDPIEIASRLSIEDISGRRYPVRDTKKSLAKLLSEWAGTN